MIGIAFWYVVFASIYCPSSGYDIYILRETFIQEVAIKEGKSTNYSEFTSVKGDKEEKCHIMNSWSEYRVVNYPSPGVLGFKRYNKD